MEDQRNFSLARRKMVHRQLLERGICSQRVLDAMDKVPRERFMLPGNEGLAYADAAIAIECGQTISQPYIVALMTEALKLTGQERVLEIGTGSGYQTAVLAELAQEVISVERHQHLSTQAGAVLHDLGYANIQLFVGDGSLGWPPLAPYDRVVVTAAAGTIPPALIEQLVVDGLLVIPIGDWEMQVLQAVHKTADGLQSTYLSGCRFVPLVGAFEPPPGD